MIWSKQMSAENGARRSVRGIEDAEPVEYFLSLPVAVPLRTIRTRMLNPTQRLSDVREQERMAR
jgi:hypothetical protein